MRPARPVHETVRKEVTAMDREGFAPRPHRHEWETPSFEEVGVSAEASAYMGIWNEWDWD
ncbi:MAG: pyrroloquinoline quinone precursor peptide PqqA [Nocardioidaceae bacterium]